MSYNKIHMEPHIKAVIEELEQEYERTLKSERIERLDRMRKLSNAINQLFRVMEIIDELPN